MKLGVDLYSIRSQGWTAHRLLDYCKGIDLEVVHFSELEPFESLEDGYLQEVKSHAEELGLDLEVGGISWPGPTNRYLPGLVIWVMPICQASWAAPRTSPSGISATNGPSFSRSMNGIA